MNIIMIIHDNTPYIYIYVQYIYIYIYIYIFITTYILYILFKSHIFYIAYIFDTQLSSTDMTKH